MHMLMVIGGGIVLMAVLHKKYPEAEKATE